MNPRRISAALCATLLSVLTVALTATALIAPQNAAAQPYLNAASDGRTPPVAWHQLGLPEQVHLIGANQPSHIELPVPPGTTPMMLTGRIGSEVNINGRVDILDERTALIASIPIPADLAVTPFSVDLSRAAIGAGVGDVVKLQFLIRDYDNSRTDSCVHPPSVILGELATSYSGSAPAPETVADFLPGYVDHITIEVGSDPSPDQQQAALTLVAELTRLYRPMPVRIDVDTSATPTRKRGEVNARTIAIREDDTPAIAVENPKTPEALLVIRGRGAELLRQVDLFADRRFQLAQTRATSVTSASEGTAMSADTKTFGELGMSGQNEVIGTTTLHLGFDAAAFAVGSVDKATVNLVASHTPVSNADASLIIRAGSVIVASQPLGESGAVDIQADIAPREMTSNVGLSLEVRYVPDRECAPLYDRMSFAVDPASTVRVYQGVDNRGGFPVLPMAFTPDFDVAVADAEQIRFAAQAVNLMGQQTTGILRPNVIPADEAVQRRTGLLIVASGEDLTRLGMDPPVSSAGPDAFAIQGAPSTTLDLTGGLGVIQAFSDNDRMVLAISSSGDDALIDRSLDYVRAQKGGWAALQGDVVATGVAQETVNLTVRAGGWMPDYRAPDVTWKWWTWATIAVGAVAAVGLLALTWTRWRRTRR